MATLAAGASASLTLTPGDQVTLEGIGNPVATLTLPNGKVVSVTLQGRPKTLGPFDVTGTATLACAGGDLVYSFVDYESQPAPGQPAGSATPAATLAALETMDAGQAGLLSAAASAVRDAYPAPRNLLICGDSLTFGTGAALPWTFGKMLLDVAGTASFRLSSTIDGVGGEKLDQIASRYVAALPGKDLGIIWGGTNDALQNYPLERSMQAITRAARISKFCGVQLVVVTPPPFYGATFGVAQYQNPVTALRSALVANARALGYICVDTWAELADSSNLLKAAYQSGDGVHLNSEAYAAVARMVAAALSAYVGVSAVKTASVSNLCANPGNAGSAPTPTGATIVGASGTAASWARMLVDDTTGTLVPGNKWLSIEADATSGAGTLTIAFAGGSIASGNVASLRSKIRITDLNGTTCSQLRANAGYVDFGVGTANIIRGGQFISESSPNEIDFRYTSVATTTHNPFLIVNLVAGQRIRLQIGDIGLFNITTSQVDLGALPAPMLAPVGGIAETQLSAALQTKVNATSGYPIQLETMAGYVADSAADNLAAFDAALTLARSTGRPIILPAATVKVVIPSNGQRLIGGVNFIGRGRAKSELILYANGNAQNATKADLPGTSFEHLTLRLDAPAGQYCVGISLEADNLSFSDCRATSHTGTQRSHLIKWPDATGNSTGLFLVNSEFENFGFTMLKTVASAWVHRTVRVLGNRFIGCTGSAAGINAPAKDTLHDVVVDNNYIQMTYLGSGQCTPIDYSGGNGVRITNNYIFGDCTDAIHLEEAVQNFEVSGNRMLLSAAKTRGIYLSDNGVGAGQDVWSLRYGKVHNNVMVYTGPAATQLQMDTAQCSIGIHTVYDGTGHEPMVSVQIQNNSVIGFNQGYYYIDFSNTKTQCLDNIAEGCQLGYLCISASGGFAGNKAINCAIGLIAQGSVVTRQSFQDCAVNIQKSTRSFIVDPSFCYFAAGSSEKALLPDVGSGAGVDVFLFSAIITNGTALHRRYSAVGYDGTSKTLTQDISAASLLGGADAYLTMPGATLKFGTVSSSGYAICRLIGSAVLS